MQNLDLKIINGTVANSTETFRSDIGIKDGVIVAIGKEIGELRKNHRRERSIGSPWRHRGALSH